MKTHILSFFGFFFLTVFGVWAQKPVNKVVFIIVDGIPEDVIQKVETPTFDAISAAGGYTKAHVGGEKGGFSETPTISAVGYNSLLTGTWVHKHNVWGNSIKAPNYHYPTVFQFAEDAGLKTAIFSTWEDNRTKLVGEGLPETGNIKLDYHFDGFENDTVNFPHDVKREYIKNIDEKVVAEAARYIQAEGPDLSWVYLEFTDDMGHGYGDSEQFYNAVNHADAQIEQIWKALKYRESNFGESWKIYITTDHGRDAETGKGHGGQSDRERSTWIVTNSRDLNTYFKESTPGVVDLMPSILRDLNLKPNKEQEREIDGIALVGDISISNLKAELTGEGKVQLSWDSYDPKEIFTVYMSPTNDFAQGGKDNYTMISKGVYSGIPIEIDISKAPVKLIKFVVEGEHNTANTWFIRK